MVVHSVSVYCLTPLQMWKLAVCTKSHTKTVCSFGTLRYLVFLIK